MTGAPILIKQDGSQVGFDKNKLRDFLQGLAYDLNTEYLDIDDTITKITVALPEKITVHLLLEFAAELIASRTIYHPDHSTWAARVEAKKISNCINMSFSETIKRLQNYHHPKTKKPNPLISEMAAKFVLRHQKLLDEAIVPDRDFDISYFGMKTLEKAYLISINGVPAETPQYLFMRVAVGIHYEGTVDEVLQTYDLMSRRYFIHASPTLFNAGTNYNHLSSCFLVAMEDDSIDGIYKTLHKTAMISKASGGIGLHVSNIRAEGSLISTSNGTSSGLVPMLRVFNNTARYVDQGGNKRPGAFAVYLEPWHADVFEILDLRKNYGKEENRARDLFYGLWVPDLFMEKVKADDDWCLFSPDESPGLNDCYGEEFNALYRKYESEGRAVRTVKAQKLWQAILESQTETGGPYMLYKDACNSKSNQKLLGTIKSSNLCCEIVEYTSKDETAVCNLGSLALPSFIKESEDSLEFDFAKLHEVTIVLARNLDKIIDVTKYPVESAEYSNKRHRPIAVGVQGLADVFCLLRLPFDSPQAKKLNIQIFETIYHGAVRGSIELAKSKGAYETFNGSPASEGILQFDMWDHKPSDLYSDWDEIKKDMMKYGLRNSLLVAPMPTASTSQILGFNECFEPFTSNIYTRRVSSGEFQVVNKYLISDLIDLGIWSKDLKDKILLNEGSVQSIDEIPLEIKKLYKTVWEIPQKVIVDMASDRGKFIDQLQSMNIHMKNPSYAKLTSCHFYAWKKGLKTGMYYLRTQAASKAIQYTIDSKSQTPVQTPSGSIKRKRYIEKEGTIEVKKKKLDDVNIYDEKVRFCRLDDVQDCESCSG